MTETYVQAQMDVVEFPDVDIIATSDFAAVDNTTQTVYVPGPGDTFLE